MKELIAALTKFIEDKKDAGHTIISIEEIDGFLFQYENQQIAKGFNEVHSALTKQIAAEKDVKKAIPVSILWLKLILGLK